MVFPNVISLRNYIVKTCSFYYGINDKIYIRIKGVKLVVKFNKEGIELIRSKIDTNELKKIGRLTENSFKEKEKWDLQNLQNIF